MAGEKTEKATPKKRRDARKEGTILKSIEINNSITIISAIICFAILWHKMLEYIMNFYTYMFSNGYSVFGDINNEETFTKLSLFICKTVFLVCGPVILLIMISGIFSNYVQVGSLFTPKLIMPKLNRISIMSGMKRIFSMKTIKDLLKSVLKVSVISATAYLLIKPLILKTVLLMNNDIFNTLEFGVSTIINISYKLIIAMVVVSIIDYIFQYFEHEKKLKMSKQEIKDEYKNTEGNPEVKSRIKEIQQRYAVSRMMQDIPGSDVIITNPTHYAVALRYNRDKDNAPIVTAKGANNIAQKIKEIAKENKIKIVENKELAQALYKTTKIGQEIPYELFNAVAEILAYIYTLRDKGRYRKG